MANTIVTKSDEILRTKEIVANKTEEYKQKYESINKHIEDIFSAEQWSGSEARTFYEKLKGFQNDFTDMYNKLRDYCRFLEKAADTYITSQESVTARAGKLAGDR